MKSLGYFIFYVIVSQITWAEIATQEENIRVIDETNNIMEKKDRGPIYYTVNDPEQIDDQYEMFAKKGNGTTNNGDGIERKTLYIVLACIAIIIIIVIFAITCYCCFFKKKKKKVKPDLKGKNTSMGYPNQVMATPKQLDVSDLQSNSERAVLALPHSIISSAGESDSEDGSMNNIIIQPQIHTIPKDNKKYSNDKVASKNESQEKVESIQDSLDTETDSRSPSFIFYPNKLDSREKSRTKEEKRREDDRDKDRQIYDKMRNDFDERATRRDDNNRRDLNEGHGKRDNYDDRYLEREYRHTGLTEYDRRNRRIDDADRRDRTQNEYSPREKRKRDEYVQSDRGMNAYGQRERPRGNEYDHRDRDKREYDQRGRARDDYGERERARGDEYNHERVRERSKEDFDRRDKARDNDNDRYPQRDNHRQRDNGIQADNDRDRRNDYDIYIRSNDGIGKKDDYDVRRVESDSRYVTTPKRTNEERSFTRRDSFNEDKDYRNSAHDRRNESPERFDPVTLKDSRYKEPYNRDVRHELNAVISIQNERSSQRKNSIDSSPHKNDISVPVPDYTAVKSAPPKAIVKPREFKGPYGQDDLDEMNNPYTYGKGKQKRQALN